MKTSKLILSAALLTGIASFSYAGMGAPYWSQQGKNAEAENAAKAAAATESTNDAANCVTCACCGSGN